MQALDYRQTVECFDLEGSYSQLQNASFSQESICAYLHWPWQCMSNYKASD